MTHRAGASCFAGELELDFRDREMDEPAHFIALQASAAALCSFDGKDPQASWDQPARGALVLGGASVHPVYRQQQWEKYYPQAVAAVTAYLAALMAEGYELRPRGNQTDQGRR